MLVRYALSQTKCRRACPLHPNVIAPCSIACQSPSHMLISPQARRVMPARVPNALAHAHLAEMLSCYAHSRAKRSRACSSQRNLIAPCPLVCQSSSRTLPPSTISLQRTRFAQRDRLHFRNWFRVDCYLALDRAQLNSTVRRTFQSPRQSSIFSRGKQYAKAYLYRNCDP